ncbi:hypothetical protein ACSQ67_021563 [Phaseolus vulgaris]
MSFLWTKSESKVYNFLLKDHDYSAVAGLERLKDKALISVTQETAWQIAREESIEDPRIQVRLLDPEDVYQVLNYDKGDEAIRSIVINLSRIKEVQLNPQVFARMNKLHFLDFYSKGSCSSLRDQGGLYLWQEAPALVREFDLRLGFCCGFREWGWLGWVGKI